MNKGTMKFKQKQEKARLLYLNSNLNQKQIAEQIGVTENTIGNWIEKFEWREFKAALTVTKEQIVKNTYLQIATIQDKVTNEKRVPTVSETDQMLKLGKLISDLDKKIDASIIIQVFIDFGNWAMGKDRAENGQNEKEYLDFVKRMVNFQDLYITNVLNRNT